MTMPTIWLIRHAESETDIGRSTSLPGTAQLTQLGFEQAQRIASAFTYTPELVITSSYLRARQTALPILQRFPHAQYDEECIVVFSHGQFILAMLSWLMQLIYDNMQQFRYFLLANHMPNGAMIKVFLPPTGEAHFSPFLTAHLSQKEEQAMHRYCHA